MTLETLANDIAEAAEKEAKALIAEAKAEAKKLLADAETKAGALREEAEQRAEKEAHLYNSIPLQRKLTFQAMLQLQH